MGRVSAPEKRSFSPYKSSFEDVVNDIKQLQLRPEHLEVLKSTPFWLIVNSIQSDVLDLEHCKKHDDGITDIIECYDVKTAEFTFGTKKLNLKENDVRLIFGIRDGDTYQIEMISGSGLRSGQGNNFLRRCFPEKERHPKYSLTKKLIYQKLKEFAAKTSQTDFQDVSRLVTLYLIATVFAPTHNEHVSWSYTYYLDQLDKICKYNWSLHILDVLITSINKKKSAYYSSCVLLLPYWLCEYTRLVKPVWEDAFPRFLKWDLRELARSMKETNIQELNHKDMKIVRGGLQISKFENSLLQGEVLLEKNEEVTTKGQHNFPTQDICTTNMAYAIDLEDVSPLPSSSPMATPSSNQKGKRVVNNLSDIPSKKPCIRPSNTPTEKKKNSSYSTIDVIEVNDGTTIPKQEQMSDPVTFLRDFAREIESTEPPLNPLCDRSKILELASVAKECFEKLAKVASELVATKSRNEELEKELKQSEEKRVVSDGRNLIALDALKSMEVKLENLKTDTDRRCEEIRKEAAAIIQTLK